MEHLKAFQNYDICKYIYVNKEIKFFESVLYINYFINDRVIKMDVDAN